MFAADEVVDVWLSVIAKQLGEYQFKTNEMEEMINWILISGCARMQIH